MIDEYTKKIKLHKRPHVVILGAGASRAATPEGEKHGLTLPLMSELPEAIELNSILDKKDYLASKNDFESVVDSDMPSGRSILSLIFSSQLFPVYFSASFAATRKRLFW